MLVAYFDESGTNAGSPAVSIAGYIASVDEWTRFQKRWQTCLRKHKYGIKYFHMTDWESGWEQFAGWEDARRFELFQELASIVRGLFRQGFCVSTILADYERYWQQRVGQSASTFCVDQCLKQVGEWAEAAGYKENIAYFFEAGAGKDGEVNRLHLEIINQPARRYAYRLENITFADKRDSTRNPLQAADILAYETWKEMCADIVPGKPLREVRRTMRILTDGQLDKYRFCFVDKDSFGPRNMI